MANVACGRFDGYWQKRIKLLGYSCRYYYIVKEAGGFVDNLKDDKSSNINNIIATNSQIHEELSSALIEKIIEKNKVLI